MKYSIGVDIGGTNTVLGLINNQGVVIARDTMLTKDDNIKWDGFFKRLFEKVGKLTELHPDLEPTGIGIGAPNGSHYSGMILDPPNLDMGNVHVPTIASKYTHLSVVLTNDANAAALGEKMFGKAQNMKDFVVITLGTGLGSGIIANGKLLSGHDGFAGEMGHIIIETEGRKCNCGKKGCLEMYVSAKGITQTVIDFHKKYPDDYLINTLINSASQNGEWGYIDGRVLDVAFDEKNETAYKIYSYTAEKLGLGLAQVATILEPEAFIFYGGVSKAGNRILGGAEKSMNNNLMSFQKGKIKLLLSGLHPGDSGILGAASLVYNEL
tara:strand:+ start:11340 stop:12311 length:972 start_codon:yes stop_codon:yes gene_type:complete